MDGKHSILIKRVYDEPAESDGLRVLVDRLWPRGMKKEAARVDVWMKEIAPSNELRKQYHQQPEKWAEFKQRYYAELEGNPQVAELIRMARERMVTLLYASRDQENNNAVVLREYLDHIH
jgi:uncharacterized protein YeaO (DUF488 family)